MLDSYCGPNILQKGFSPYVPKKWMQMVEHKFNSCGLALSCDLGCPQNYLSNFPCCSSNDRLLTLYILACVILDTFLKYGCPLSVLSLLFFFYLLCSSLLPLDIHHSMFLRQERKYLFLSHFYTSLSLSHLTLKILFWEIQAEGRKVSVTKKQQSHS